MRFIAPSYEIISYPNGQELIQLTKKISDAVIYTQQLNTDFIDKIKHYTVEVKFISNHEFTRDVINSNLDPEYIAIKEAFNSTISVTPMESKWLMMKTKPSTFRAMKLFTAAYNVSETTFMKLIKMGVPIQVAKEVLPISLKTEICIKTNLSEWRKLLRLRCSNQAHLRMRQLMIPLLHDLQERIPYVFDDLVEKYPLGQTNEVPQDSNNS